jgi:uncharacterized protein (TIGR03083 family)
MEYARYLDTLSYDFDRLRAVVVIDPTAAVPTCPGWTVGDLTHHVGEVYLHKTIAMRDGVEPDPWPPKEVVEEEPLVLLDRAYAALRHEFDVHQPEDRAGSWYTPDQTVGFWIRRMAHETVIHRVDAELGTGQMVVPVAPDLALDGIDELLKVFVAFGVVEWGNYFTDVLGRSPGRTYTVRADGAAWHIESGPGVFAVQDGAGDEPTDATISGSPTAVLRWVWNREVEPTGVTVEGTPEAVEELKRCIVIATQ